MNPGQLSSYTCPYCGLSYADCMCWGPDGDPEFETDYNDEGYDDDDVLEDEEDDQCEEIQTP